MDIRDKALLWLANGRTGVSSKAMLFAALGIEQKDVFRNDNYPHDPDDLNRCLLMLEAVPEVREAFDKIASLSPQWEALIGRWSEIEESFLDEVGLRWTRGSTAPHTYRLMRELYERGNG